MTPRKKEGLADIKRVLDTKDPSEGVEVSPYEEAIRRKQMREASQSTDKLRESTKTLVLERSARDPKVAGL